EYEKYLQQIIELSGKVKKPSTATEYPTTMDSPAKRALYDNLGKNESLAMELDESINYTKKDGWRDNLIKSKAVRNAIADTFKRHGKTDEADVHRIFDLVKNQREY